MEIMKQPLSEEIYEICIKEFIMVHRAIDSISIIYEHGGSQANYNEIKNQKLKRSRTITYHTMHISCIWLSLLHTLTTKGEKVRYI